MSISIEIPVSHGELVDKLTILQIKRERLKRADQLRCVEDEWSLLYPLMRNRLGMTVEHPLYRQLLQINTDFWDYHDWQRARWAQSVDTQVDLELYRRSKDEHVLNDRRARVKLEINRTTRSRIVEQKQFPIYCIGGEKAD